MYEIYTHSKLRKPMEEHLEEIMIVCNQRGKYFTSKKKFLLKTLHSFEQRYNVELSVFWEMESILI